jgi:hypothetical protein
MSLPRVPPLSLIASRLPLIFPEGTTHRGYVIREMSAKTIYVMFYVGAVVGTGRYIRPSQVTDMSDDQAAMLSDEEREAWTKRSLSRKKTAPLNPWYAVNSRESIRDETVRLGLIPLGAVTERTDLDTTSGSPRYAMAEDFLKLFDTDVSQEEVDNRITKWRKAHLSQAALTRTHLVREGRSRSKDAVVVTFPNGETRSMKAGKSSVIAKAVIEEYATRFLKEPVVLWMSESGKKVVQQDDTLAKQLKLHIDPSKALPDIILVDLGEQVDGSELLVVFVEVVASDGPVHEHRKKALTDIAIQAGFELSSLRFLTAFADRSDSKFKKAVSDLAWDTAAWFVSEPDKVVLLESLAPPPG